MNRDAFDALLARRDDLARQHERACGTLEEEGPSQAHYNYRKCARLYDQLTAVQQQIDDAIAAERAADSTI